jgi:Chain length determinant protein
VTTLDSTLPRAADGRASPGPGPPPRRDEPESALGPLRPVVERWPLVLVVVLLCVGGAVYAGMARSPTYRADTQINIGRTDVRVQALPGYVAGAATLANSYSRVVQSDEIVDRVAAALDRSRASVAQDLTAAPIPENPILRIVGEGESPEAAVRLTATATSELERYVSRTDAATESFEAALREFREQSRRAADLRRQLNELEEDQTVAGASSVSAAEEEDLRVDYETAKLRADSLGQMYRDRQVELASTAGIEVISRPAPAGDDRRSVMQRLIAVGLVGGVVVGSALAMLLGPRRRRPVA